MTSPEQVSDFQDDQRFARMNALYDAYLGNGSSDRPAVSDDMNQDLIEVACEFAPSVRRRTRRISH